MPLERSGGLSVLFRQTKSSPRHRLTKASSPTCHSAAVSKSRSMARERPRVATGTIKSLWRLRTGSLLGGRGYGVCDLAEKPANPQGHPGALPDILKPSSTVFVKPLLWGRAGRVSSSHDCRPSRLAREVRSQRRQCRKSPPHCHGSLCANARVLTESSKTSLAASGPNQSSRI